MNDSLLTACQNESPEQIAAAMMATEFLLVNVSESGQDDTSALVLDVDGFAALVGFTSDDHAGTFAELTEIPLNDEDELPCFVVAGHEFLSNLPKKFGIAINPETEHSFLFPPAFARKIKSNCG